MRRLATSKPQYAGGARWWRSLALVDGISGNLDAACRDIDRARALNPRQALLYGNTESLDCPGPEPKPPS